jgi:hypothetical protein
MQRTIPLGPMVVFTRSPTPIAPAKKVCVTIKCIRNENFVIMTYKFELRKLSKVVKENAEARGKKIQRRKKRKKTNQTSNFTLLLLGASIQNANWSCVRVHPRKSGTLTGAEKPN